jgi:hypothetical protein
MPAPAQDVPGDSLAYAETLYVYAGDRLDPFSLRCWIIRRLMLDKGLEHACAERAFEHAVDVVRRRERARRARLVGMRRRRASIRTLPSLALASTKPIFRSSTRSRVRGGRVQGLAPALARAAVSAAYRPRRGRIASRSTGRRSS